uniref:Mu-like prophage FluMu N-terminal domain-containing protein n=1 Tax=viral metagenome TaxID=1070528 RepID=A0A6H1ZEH8_9ZZZZ
MAKTPVKAAVKPAAKAAAKKAVANQGAETELLDGIFVRSLPPTFRRAGFTFTRDGFGLLLENLTQAQLDAIEAEPMLSVTQAQFPATAEADAKLAELAKAQAATEPTPPAAPTADDAKANANSAGGTGGTQGDQDNTEGNA